MAGDSKNPQPLVVWAQRTDRIFLTINLEDVKDPKIELTEDKLYFKGTGGTDRMTYELEVEFYKKVIPNESKYRVEERHIPMNIKKEKDEAYWPRLLKTTKRMGWLKTDFDKWKDEDDSDVEDSQDMDLSDMMKQMGNFNTNAPEVENEEDSDDEELPDLE